MVGLNLISRIIKFGDCMDTVGRMVLSWGLCGKNSLGIA